MGGLRFNSPFCLQLPSLQGHQRSQLRPSRGTWTLRGGLWLRGLRGYFAQYPRQLVRGPKMFIPDTQRMVVWFMAGQLTPNKVSITRWWFLDICYFHPLLGEDVQFDSYFSDGLVQPLTIEDFRCFPGIFVGG